MKSETNHANEKPENARKSVFVYMLLILPSLIALGAAGFFYMQWQEAQKQASSGSPTEAQKQEITQIEEELSEIVLLPEDETPTLSTITDTDKLKENREFFEDAEKGDKVLVYPNVGKAYLYRPGTHKLINMAPVNIRRTNGGQQEEIVAGSSHQQSAQDSPSPTP